MQSHGCHLDRILRPAEQRPVCGSTLFLITGLFDGAANRSLALFQGLIDVRFTRQHSRDILAHYCAEGLKLRDAHKLDAGVWHRLNAGFCRVGRLHGI
jgi:hypothetical protein